MKLFASFKDKRFRYGTLSTVMILFAIAIFVFVNLVAGQFNVTKDLTDNEMFSLTSYSKEFLAELDEDVNIYALMPTGQENILLRQLLDEYAALSPHINVEYRDPNLYPTFAQQFAENGEGVTNNSVVVEGANRYKVIAPTDMVTYEMDYTTYQQTVTGINFESEISKAIHYVTLDETAVIYHVKGSSEYDIPQSLSKQFADAGYDFRTVDLVLGEVPEDTDMLFITMPSRDWTADEAARILAYLQSGGRAMFVLGYTPARYENMDNVLAAYGVKTGDYIVLEGDADHYYMNNPQYIVPEFTDFEMTEALYSDGYRCMVVQATGIDELDVKKTSTVIDPVLVTSGDAYGRIDTEITTVNKADGDAEGPFNLGVAVTDSTFINGESLVTKFVMFSCEALMDESFNEFIGGTNFGAMVSGLNWLYGQPDSLYIPSKAPSEVTTLSVTQMDANIMMFVSVILLPLACVAAGVTVWFRRRHS